MLNPTQKPAVAVEPTPADLLRFAALYLERHGWTQGSLFKTGTGEFFPPACARGALQVAATGDPYAELTNIDERLVRRAVCELADRLFLPTDDPVDAVEFWNDEPGRTFEEVIDGLRAAANTWDLFDSFLPAPAVAPIGTEDGGR